MYYINFQNKVISKDAGKNTTVSEISFNKFNNLILHFEKVIDCKSANDAFKKWQKTFSDQDLKDFLEAVIVKYGEGFRIWGKHFKDLKGFSNENAILKRALNEINSGELEKALITIRSINGLGLSYASKILRFLSPRGIVLDSILREELGIDEKYFNQFMKDCESIANILNIEPRQVESGIFTWIQALKNNQKKVRWMEAKKLL